MGYGFCKLVSSFLQRPGTECLYLPGKSEIGNLGTGTHFGGYGANRDLKQIQTERTQSNATGFLFFKFLACSNANAICSTPQSS